MYHRNSFLDAPHVFAAASMSYALGTAVVRMFERAVQKRTTTGAVHWRGAEGG